MESGQLDPAPIWSDLQSFPWNRFRDRVHVLSGGYPCQPFSAAGKRLGADDPRHLWPSISTGIAILRPSVCFLENVEGHITLGLSTVVSDLEEMGHKVSWGIFSASECGAPHQRKRVFVMAVANAIPEGLQRCLREQSNPGWLQQQAGRGGNGVWPARPGQPQHAWEPPSIFKPSLGGDADGPAGGLDNAELFTSCDNRTDELRLLGNGVVPATAAKAFKTLWNQLSRGATVATR
jgi:site-specific DNA-cytosine methylase